MGSTSITADNPDARPDPLIWSPDPDRPNTWTRRFDADTVDADGLAVTVTVADTLTRYPNGNFTCRRKYGWPFTVSSMSVTGWKHDTLAGVLAAADAHTGQLVSGAK